MTVSTTPFGVEIDSTTVDSSRLQSSDGWVGWLKLVGMFPEESLDEQLHRLARGDDRELDPLLPVIGQSREELATRLIGLVRSRGFSVVIEDLECGRIGEWHPFASTIRLSERLEAGEMAAVLLHELGHAFDPGTRVEYPDASACELIAESAAFIVGRRLGLGMDEVSWYYTVTYALTSERATQLARDTLALADRLGRLVAQLEGDG